MTPPLYDDDCPQPTRKCPFDREHGVERLVKLEVKFESAEEKMMIAVDDIRGIRGDLDAIREMISSVRGAYWVLVFLVAAVFSTNGLHVVQRIIELFSSK